jgi:hypothetical protein
VNLKVAASDVLGEPFDAPIVELKDSIVSRAVFKIGVTLIATHKRALENIFLI